MMVSGLGGLCGFTVKTPLIVFAQEVGGRFELEGMVKLGFGVGMLGSWCADFWRPG